MVQSHVPALCTAGYHPPSLKPLASMGPRHPGTLRGPAPYSLHPAPHSPVPHTLHSPFYTLYPTPYTLYLIWPGLGYCWAWQLLCP